MFKNSLNLFTGLFLCLSLKLYAADVNLTINGRVVAKACTVNTETVSINLGRLPVQKFKTASTTTNTTEFSLQLTNCPVGTSSVEAVFDGIADSNDSNFFANEGTAERWQLRLIDSSKKQYIGPGDKIETNVDELSSSASFNLGVFGISNEGNPTVGSIKSTINVTYNFN